jgi:hypothetical protein
MSSPNIDDCKKLLFTINDFLKPAKKITFGIIDLANTSFVHPEIEAKLNSFFKNLREQYLNPELEKNIKNNKNNMINNIK